MYSEQESLEYGQPNKSFDDDGRIKRTGERISHTNFYYNNMNSMRIRMRMKMKMKMFRYIINGELTHNHRGDRFWRVVVGVGDSAARVGGGPRRADGVLLHHIFHLHPTCRLLPLPRPRPRRQKLHIHGCCACSLR